MVALQILVLSVQVRILVSQPWRFPGNRLIFLGGVLFEKKGGAVSRFLFLNLSFIFATYPLATGGQPLTASIFGLAGPGAVPVTCRHAPS